MMNNTYSVKRRYVLLGGQAYYATGGFNDFISSFDTLEEAQNEAIRLEELKGMYSLDWWHIWDCENNSIVAKGKGVAYGADENGPRLDGE